MANFNAAISTILKHEGGLVDNKHDTGGITNYGVSLRFLRDTPLDIGDVTRDGVIDADDIRRLSRDDAVRIYKRMWWDRYKYGQLEDTTVATKIFDFSVNMGATRAHKLLQQALNKAFGMRLVEDGVVGPSTIAAINAIGNTQRLIDAYSNEAWGFYQSIVRRNPSQRVFLQGWKNRAFSISRANSIV